jgi:hypothetical protein
MVNGWFSAASLTPRPSTTSGSLTPTTTAKHVSPGCQSPLQVLLLVQRARKVRGQSHDLRARHGRGEELALASRAPELPA